MSDGRLATLKRADPVEMDVVQKRYQHIADTIDDAVTKLQKIVDAGEEGLRGDYVEPLKKDAASLKDSLSKAARRYRDVATECGKYEPELQRAIDETKKAEREEADGDAALIRANAMPDPQQGADGTISPEEQQRGVDKGREQEKAAGAVSAAKNRLTAALDALDVAGKAFGDAVNCKNYDDGLTDKISWRVMVIFKKLSEAFGIIALILAVVAFLIPGVGVWAIVAVVASVVASAMLLIVDSVLLAGGDGSVLSVVLDAFGLGFAGLGALLTKFPKIVNTAGAFWKTLHGKWKPIFNENGDLIRLVDLSRPIVVAGAKPGFFNAGWNWLKGAPGAWWKGLPNHLWGADTLKGLDFLGSFGGMGKGADLFKWVWGLWGGLNQAFNLAAGVIIGTMQVIKYKGLEGR